jgi:pimeloyl-ACP methyl ester carboxylesterase
VLIHGIGASLYIWRFLMPLAARRYRVVALDLPGFGQSDKRRDADYGLDAQANRVTAFLDQLGVGEACLVGSSMGGTIALWMARQNPRRFSRVVGIAPATQPRLPLVNLSRLRHVPVRAHRWINSRVMKQLLRQVTARPELMTDEAIDQYLRPYRDSGDGTVTFLLATRILQDARLPKALRDVQSSCLILYGMNDRLISLRMMQDLESLIPRAKLLVHPTAGHHSMEDEPDWVMAEIDHIHSS